MSSALGDQGDLGSKVLEVSGTGYFAGRLFCPSQLSEQSAMIPLPNQSTRFDQEGLWA